MELSKDEILQLNRMKNRYSRKQIRSFVLDQMVNGTFTVTSDTVSSLEDFEKLVLAYDDSVRKDSPYRVLDQEAHGGACRLPLPRLVFVRRIERMIDYFEALSSSEQEQVSESIRLLYRQTFLLERTYDRKTKRYQTNPEFYQCNQHLEFIQKYFSIMGIEVVENSQMGLIYIRGEQVVGEKLPKLATLYVLILKLIYDEQMSSVSTSVNVITTLSEIHEKLGTYRLLKKQPSVSEIRRSLAMLKSTRCRAA